MFFLFLVPLSCDEAYYDFSPGSKDTDSDIEPTACSDLTVEQNDCTPTGGNCVGDNIIATTNISESLGCTPPGGPALGIIRIDPVDWADDVDLYAWIEPDYDQPGSFKEDASLAVFTDKCGDDPLGMGDDLDCEYNPWLLTAAVPSYTSLYLHVQTAKAEDSVRVGYQLRSRSDWLNQLPPGDEPLTCQTAPDGLLIPLEDPNPLGGGTVSVDMEFQAPAFNGEPWICDKHAAGWRQVAFLLRNNLDYDVRVTGLNLYPADITPINQVISHYSFLRCSDEGVIDADMQPAAASCQDEGPIPELDVVIEHWAAPEDPEPLYVLVLQLPPSIQTTLDMTFEVEPAL